MIIRLTYYERQQIEHFLRIGWKAPRIAKRLNRDRTVIWREITRNHGQFFPYVASRAEYFSNRRARKTNRRKLEKDEILHDWVVKQLEDWSPEQAAGRLRKYPPPELKGKSISHEAIYQWIYDKEPWLLWDLKQQHYERKFKLARKHRSKIQERVSINDRPECINGKQEVGHFESDSVVGKGKKTNLSVQYERKIMLCRLHKINSTAQDTREALQQTIETLPQQFVKSITFDNGSENVEHRAIRDTYNVKTFFCEPYKAWQKGGVENLNHLIRHFFPKGTSFETVPEGEIQRVEELLNNRPRKSLNYKTPNEMLLDYQLQNVALNS